MANKFVFKHIPMYKCIQVFFKAQTKSNWWQFVENDTMLHKYTAFDVCVLPSVLNSNADGARRSASKNKKLSTTPKPFLYKSQFNWISYKSKRFPPLTRVWSDFPLQITEKWQPRCFLTQHAFCREDTGQVFLVARFIPLRKSNRKRQCLKVCCQWRSFFPILLQSGREKKVILNRCAMRENSFSSARWMRWSSISRTRATFTARTWRSRLSFRRKVCTYIFSNTEMMQYRVPFR